MLIYTPKSGYFDLRSYNAWHVGTEKNSCYLSCGVICKVCLRAGLEQGAAQGGANEGWP